MDKITTVKERILFFLELKGIKKESFYKDTGNSASNFKSVGLKSDLGIEKLVKILTVYPELNYYLDWLIKGEGDLQELMAERATNERIKKERPISDLSVDEYLEDKEINNDEDRLKSLGKSMGYLFAKMNAVDKSLQFIQSKVSEIAKNSPNSSSVMDDHKKALDEIIKLLKKDLTEKN